MSTTSSDPFGPIRAALTRILDTQAGAIEDESLAEALALIPPAPDPREAELFRLRHESALQFELGYLCTELKMAGCAHMVVSPTPPSAEMLTAVLEDTNTALGNPPPVKLPAERVAERAVKLVAVGVAAERMRKGDLDGATAVLAACNGILPADWHRGHHTSAPGGKR